MGEWVDECVSGWVYVYVYVSKGTKNELTGFKVNCA